MAENAKMKLEFIRLREVQQRTQKSRSTIYRDELAGSFPQRRKIGKNSVAWLSSEIDEWITSRNIGLKSGVAK